MLQCEMKSPAVLSLGLGVGLAILLFVNVCGALTLSRVLVPSYKFHCDSAVLECPYELGRNQRDRLYAVKWYFNGEEFYRYVPKYIPPILTHQVRGINVKIGGSDSRQVTLENLSLYSSGVYRCEVSCEAPDFSSVHGEGVMTVIHLPEKGPQINGNVKEDYTPGDILDINCTTSESFPPARLSWYLNDLPVPKQYVIDSSPRYGVGPPPEQLVSSVSTLRLPLEDDHFTEDGDTKILCKANISPTFWQDGDERIVGSQRKTDLRSTFNVAPVTLFDQDALLYLRGSCSAIHGTLWTLILTTTMRSLVSHFISLL